MASRSAITALKKLENDRKKLDAKQRELETKVATELGRTMLGSGVEEFATKNLKRIAMTLGKMGEEQALAKLGIGTASSTPK